MACYSTYTMACHFYFTYLSELTYNSKCNKKRWDIRLSISHPSVMNNILIFVTCRQTYRLKLLLKLTSL